ncbi:hypothetical protein B0O99DRAFT_620132 [Bisporella sp. PMI_857]|nr:hypothetical protein B0O99DRAFT_620132 [Bisporella sp. PMI_857]
MKSTTFALGSLLASIAVAQPHRHQAHHHKRAEQPVEWVTEWEYVYETVGVTTTICVTEGQEAPTAAPAASSTPAAYPAQFFEPQQPSAPAAVPTTSSSSVYVAPSPAVEAVVEPVVESSSAAAPVTPVPVVVAPVVTPQVAATPTTSSAAPAVYSSSASSSDSGSSSGTGSATATCEGKDNLCAGELTYYDPVPESYGACGWHNDGLKEKVIALPHGLMGTQSNGNPYCGRKVTILHNGKSTVAEVVDKCMGCEGRAIDISRLAFDDLDDQAVGRTTATWYFSD